MNHSSEFRTIDLDDGIIEVTFLRGKAGGAEGWWCIRRGKNFSYEDLSFFEGMDHPRWGTQKTTRPTPENAAKAVHLAFCDATGEGLSCPVATRANVAVRSRMSDDGIVYTVIAKRTRTERVAASAESVSVH